jgi:hypothetical protein
MLASGHLIVEAVNLFGKPLACLDLRKSNNSINLRGAAERLAYVDLESNENFAIKNENARENRER